MGPRDVPDQYIIGAVFLCFSVFRDMNIRVLTFVFEKTRYAFASGYSVISKR